MWTFKQIKEKCLDAEIAWLKEGPPGEPSFPIEVNHLPCGGEKVNIFRDIPVLEGFELYGDILEKDNDGKAILVLLKCKDVRIFFERFDLEKLMPIPMKSEKNIERTNFLSFNELERFFENYPEMGADPLSTILKGHLLIEEVLREFTKVGFKNPSAFEEAEFTFNQVLCIAKARTRGLDWIWTAIKKLNKLRNNVAHNLVPRGFEDRIEDFIRFVEENKKGDTTLINASGEIDRLNLAISTIHTNLTAKIEGLRRGFFEKTEQMYMKI